MNECKHFHAPGVLHEPCKDCLIEHQATRIAELESRQVVSGAMCVIEGRCLSGEQYQRIKELEAALCEEVEARSKWYCEADRLKEELAALRQRIDDAPVVAWMSPGKERLEFSLPSTVYGSHTIPLISKEDLK